MKMWADKEETYGYHLTRIPSYADYVVDLPEDLLVRFQNALAVLEEVHHTVQKYIDDNNVPYQVNK